jgi:hypothetical protein
VVIGSRAGTYLGESDGGDGADGGDAATWRDSSTPWVPPPVPYCEAQTSPMPFDLWSDSTGIYVLYGWDRPEPTGDGSWFFSVPPLLTISHNAGSGWTEFFRAPCDDRFGGGATSSCVSRIRGILEGRLLGWGSYTPVYGFEPGMVERMWPDLYNIDSLFVVNDDLAYAMWQAGPDSRVVRYDGTGWSPVPVALPFDSAVYGKIWANETDVFVAGGSAVLLSLDGEEWRIHDPGTVSDLTSLWGFGSADVWVGTVDGQLRHFDGATWSDVPWSSRDDGSICNEDKPIQAMWGADGILYFITETQFARWNGTEVEVLAHWPRTNITTGAVGCTSDLTPVALWGNSPTEVFLTVARPNPARGIGTYCDGVAVLWWDGTTLRQI